MAAPIFPNCSYLLAIGTSSELVRRLEASSVQNQCRSFLCRTLDEFKGVRKVTESIIGIIVNYDDFTKAEKREIQEFLKTDFPESKLVPILALGILENDLSEELPTFYFDVKKSPVDDQAWEDTFDDFIDKMTPQGLDRMLLHALNVVLPSFFPGVGSFSLGKQALKGFDFQLNYSLSAGDIVGLCSVRIKWQAILALVPPDKKEKAWDILKESFNQAIGVIIQNIVKLGIDMKLGLPTVFDLARVPYVQTMKFYPSVHVIDSTETFACSVGFYHLTHQSLFDLSTSDPTRNSEEIEFL